MATAARRSSAQQVGERRGADNKVVIKQRVQQWGRAGDIELEHIKYLMLVRNTRLYNLMNIGDQSGGVQ